MGLNKKRDFTEKKEKELLNLSKSLKNYNIDQISKINEILAIIMMIYDSSLWSFLPYIDEIKEFFNALINNAEYNVTKLGIKEKDIRNAFINVREEDARISKYISNIADDLKGYNGVLKELDYVIDSKNKAFTTENINNRLGNSITDYLTDLENENEVDDITYVENEESDPYLREDYNVEYKNIKNNSEWYHTVVIAWNEKEKIIASKVKDLIKKITGESGLDAYEESTRKQAIKDALDDYANESSWAITKATKSANDYVSQMKNFKSIEEFIDSDIYKNKDTNKIIEALGGAEKVWKYIKDAPELLEYIFSNYVIQKEAFKLLYETYKDDYDYCNILDELNSYYNNKFLGLISKLKDYSIEQVSKETTKIILKLFGKGATGLYSLITSSIDIGMEVTGGSEWAKNWVKFEANSSNYDMYQSVYEKYLNKIQNGNYTKDDVDKLKTAFEMMKTSITRSYEIYRDMCKDPVEKSEIQKEIIRIKNTQLNVDEYYENLNNRSGRF